MLAMFAAHAHANQDNKIESKSGGKSWDFMNRAVPFYATCLIEVWLSFFFSLVSVTNYEYDTRIRTLSRGA